MFRKILLIAASSWTVAMLLVSCMSRGPSDNEIRSNVVSLMENGHRFCTAEQVIAPSGKKYLLSASHCAFHSIGKEVEAENEDGARYSVTVLAEDDMADLILLTPVKTAPGLSVGKQLAEREPVRAFTRGLGYRTFRTEGVTIEVSRIEIPAMPLDTAQDMENCKAHKFQPGMVFIFPACIMAVDSMATTVFVAPGSSGGPLLNARGELVGVATAIGEGFSYWVPLADIKRFLADK